MADALETLAYMSKLIWLNHRPSIEVRCFNEDVHYVTTTKQLDKKKWFYDIKRYLEKQEYPVDASSIDKRTLRRLASKFFSKWKCSL